MFLHVQTMVWLPVSGIFYVCADVVHLFAQGGYVNTVRQESALEAEWEKKPLPHHGLDHFFIFLAFACTWGYDYVNTKFALKVQSGKQIPCHTMELTLLLLLLHMGAVRRESALNWVGEKSLATPWSWTHISTAPDFGVWCFINWTASAPSF